MSNRSGKDQNQAEKDLQKWHDAGELADELREAYENVDSPGAGQEVVRDFVALALERPDKVRPEVIRFVAMCLQRAMAKGEPPVWRLLGVADKAARPEKSIDDDVQLFRDVLRAIDDGRAASLEAACGVLIADTYRGRFRSKQSMASYFRKKVTQLADKWMLVEMADKLELAREFVAFIDEPFDRMQQIFDQNEDEG